MHVGDMQIVCILSFLSVEVLEPVRQGYQGTNVYLLGHHLSSPHYMSSMMSGGCQV